MGVDAKLLQVFLSPSNAPAPNISEVYIDTKGSLFCTCPGFRGRSSCKHASLVQQRMDENDGAYPMELSNRVTQEDADIASKSTEAFRAFVVKFGKVEVY